MFFDEYKKSWKEEIDGCHSDNDLLALLGRKFGELIMIQIIANEKFIEKLKEKLK